MTSPGNHDAEQCPDRRTLKRLILWCARWLLSSKEFYRGQVKVDISYGRERDSVSVRPNRDVTGLRLPDGMGEMITRQGWAGGAGAGGDAAGVKLEVTPDIAQSQVKVSDLRRCFLSPEETRILRSLASRQPSTAQSVCDEMDITRSTFFAFWGNLQGRGLVAENDAGKFELAAEWIKTLLAEMVGASEK